MPDELGGVLREEAVVLEDLSDVPFVPGHLLRHADVPHGDRHNKVIEVERPVEPEGEVGLRARARVRVRMIGRSRPPGR